MGNEEGVITRDQWEEHCSSIASLATPKLQRRLQAQNSFVLYMCFFMLTWDMICERERLPISTIQSQNNITSKFVSVCGLNNTDSNCTIVKILKKIPCSIQK